MTLPHNKTNCCIFDFDSTIVSIETLDFLIEQSGGDPKAIHAITNQAMGGKMSFSESLKKRFEHINITKADITALQSTISDYISDGLTDFLQHLQETHDFYIISGGFLDIIYPAADTLNIPRENCFANEFIYNETNVTGFNEQNLLAHDGGKVKVANQHIIKPNHYRNIFMIGDGYTDLEVSKSNPDITFCGFGGHVVRQSVQQEAQHFFNNFEQMLRFVRQESDE